MATSPQFCRFPQCTGFLAFHAVPHTNRPTTPLRLGHLVQNHRSHTHRSPITSYAVSSASMAPRPAFQIAAGLPGHQRLSGDNLHFTRLSWSTCRTAFGLCSPPYVIKRLSSMKCARLYGTYYFCISDGHLANG
jgi:hypothetical protein